MMADKRKRTEIGSEFWEVPTQKRENGIFSNNTEWFISGRFALSAIIKDICKKKTVHTAYLPAWCCDSMISPFVEQGLHVRFYPVYMENGILKQDIEDGRPGEILYLMDYFGFQSQVDVSKGGAVVIRDVTHSIFSGFRCDADYYFGSLRKWAGFYTAGFACGISNESLPVDNRYIDLRRTAMLAKAAYIAGTSESKDYLDLFGEAEEYLEQCASSAAYKEDIRRAKRMDVSFIREQRRKNAAVLMEAFSNMVIFSAFGKNDCPLFVPILVPDNKRDELRSYLIRKEIYCPIHWPCTHLHHPDKKTMCLYENELSLICDQRYNETDMIRIIEAIRAF